MSGLEELLAHLDALRDSFSGILELKAISFLLSRGKSDFVVAIDAALGGISSVVFDKMRDAMEIHFLLRDFLFNPAHIQEWLTTNERARLKKFSPAQLRARYAQAVGIKPADLPDERDYKGHSKQLHVSPNFFLFGVEGIAKNHEFLEIGVCLSEMFDHAYNLLDAADKLGRNFAKDGWTLPDPTTSLKKFLDGGSSTTLYKSLFVAVVSAVEKSD